MVTIQQRNLETIQWRHFDQNDHRQGGTDGHHVPSGVCDHPRRTQHYFRSVLAKNA